MKIHKISEGDERGRSWKSILRVTDDERCSKDLRQRVAALLYCFRRLSCSRKQVGPHPSVRVVTHVTYKPEALLRGGPRGLPPVRSAPEVAGQGEAEEEY